MTIVLGITGASGGAYALDFLERCSAPVLTLISHWGERVLEEEIGGLARVRELSHRLWRDDDLEAPVASGSNPFEVMVVLPCTVSTLGKIAAGIGDTLVTRTAAVALKEGRRLILCLRETPLSAVALENALKLSRLGVVILPACPPFYGRPESAADLVRAYVDKVLRAAGRAADAGPGWRSEELE